MVNRDLYNKMAGLVIDKLEGGYYHPNMLLDGRVKDQRYKDSGETMMGIDRKAGGAINTTPAGQKFWATIDSANAKNTWKWNYKGGSLEPTLRAQAADVMFPSYDKYASLYLTPEARAIVESDGGLLFHFIYGTWNGPGWFQKFASDINAQVKNGVRDTTKLKAVAIASRTNEGLKKGSAPNSLVAQGGNKIAQFIYDLPSNAIEVVKKNPWTVGLITAAALVSAYVLFKTLKKK